jgi:nucleoside-diphosphate-sugar epimerase
MPKHAFVLGGTGFVGRHAARRLADAGWEVTLGSRGEASIPIEVEGLRHVAVDRSDDVALRDAVGSGVDVFIDVIPYEIADATQLVGLKDRIGSVVAISTCSVYADDDGRTLDEATSEPDFPRLPVPIQEDQPRASPGEATYSTKKTAIEDILLGQADLSVTIIRPCAIFGPGDTQCREWFFIKRALDERPFVLLADEGETVFHTTSVHNLAEMVRLAAGRPIHGAFNCGDPDPPNVRRIARSIAEVMDHEWKEVLLPRTQSKDREVRNPWGGFHPWVVAMDKARDLLDYAPVVSYEEAIVKTVDWVVDATRDKDWRAVLPKAADYLGSSFDYEAEDELLRNLSRAQDA